MMRVISATEIEVLRKNRQHCPMLKHKRTQSERFAEFPTYTQIITLNEDINRILHSLGTAA
jgi:hypothetical protein